MYKKLKFFLFSLIVANSSLFAEEIAINETISIPQFSSLADLVEVTSPSVVRIAIKGTVRSQPNPFFDDPFFERFFGQPQMPREREFGGGGSGVIVDNDRGYIITNHHVIKSAIKILIYRCPGFGASGPNFTSLFCQKKKLIIQT